MNTAGSDHSMCSITVTPRDESLFIDSNSGLEPDNENKIYKPQNADLEHQPPDPEIRAGSFGGEDGFRTLGRWETTIIFITNEVGLGVLSLPAALQQLGLIPGIIAIVGIGVLTTYTAYVLLQFYRRYPHIVNIVDCARILGGKPLEWIIGLAFIVNLCLTCASSGLTMSIALNSISGHALCTVGFIAFPIIGCWLLCIPRSFKFVAKLGIPSTVSIVAAILIVMIAIGVSGPQNAPPGFERKIALVGNPTFVQGMASYLNICFAYAGNQGFLTVMAEMKDPGKDFVPALLYLQTFAVVIYTVVAAVIYSFAGQYTTSPALGAAPLLAAKIAYGVVFPSLLGTGLVFGHTAIKYIFVLSMRLLGAGHELASNTRRSWTVWLATGISFWTVAFVIANLIPVFGSILGVSSAIFVSWFTFGISGVIWLHLNWDRQLENKRKMSLAALNWAVIVIALVMNSGGMYAAISGLLRVFADPEIVVAGPFTCADNGIF